MSWLSGLSRAWKIGLIVVALYAAFMLGAWVTKAREPAQVPVYVPVTNTRPAPTPDWSVVCPYGLLVGGGCKSAPSTSHLP